MMYDSKPKDREGEAIERLVGEAIEVSASESRRTDAMTANASGQSQSPQPKPDAERACRILTGVAGAEFLAILGLIFGLC